MTICDKVDMNVVAESQTEKDKQDRKRSKVQRDIYSEKAREVYKERCRTMGRV